MRWNSETFRNFCIIQLKYVFVMARPIKETPILYGEDARRFEARMKENVIKAKKDAEFTNYENVTKENVNITIE